MTKEKVTAAIVQITVEVDNPNDMGRFGGDSVSYYLPGADYQATRKALEGAGFKMLDMLRDAVDDMNREDDD